MLLRDVKRRIQAITSYLHDLKKMDVPCILAYATTWTGNLYVIGEDRMTNEFQSISSSLLKCSPEVPASEPASTLIVPELLGASSLNLKILSTMLVSLGKDLRRISLLVASRYPISASKRSCFREFQRYTIGWSYTHIQNSPD